MKTTIVCWGYIRILQKKMETHYSMLVLFWDNGKQNETTILVYWSYIGIMEQNMETTIVFPRLPIHYCAPVG